LLRIAVTSRKNIAGIRTTPMPVSGPREQVSGAVAGGPFCEVLASGREEALVAPSVPAVDEDEEHPEVAGARLKERRVHASSDDESTGNLITEQSLADVRQREQGHQPAGQCRVTVGDVHGLPVRKAPQQPYPAGSEQHAAVEGRGQQVRTRTRRSTARVVLSGGVRAAQMTGGGGRETGPDPVGPEDVDLHHALDLLSE
jgi:hypothetical protein